MALVTFINSIFSGKIGGTVYANNKGGSYARIYKKGTDPATSAQLNNRANFTAASTTWHALTDAQKAVWNTFAITNFKPKTGNPGARFSGFNAFVSLCNVVTNAGLKSSMPTITDPVGVTATFVPFAFSQDAPTHPLSSMIKDHAGHPLGIQLYGVTLDGASGQCTADFHLMTGGVITPTTTAPTFQDAIGATPVGIAIVASLPIVQNQQFVSNPDINLVAIIPAPASLTGWTSSDSISFDCPPLADYNFRKLGYETGDTVQFKAYLIGINGQTQPLNAIKTQVV